MSEKTFFMTELEEKLYNDSNGQYRQELLEKLQQYSAQIKTQMDEGLSPDEFKKAQQLKEAVDTAISIVQNFVV